MDAIPPPDSHYLSAVIGWLELGCPQEAENELGRIREPYQGHPDVLEARWRYLATKGDWNQALTVARELKQTAPDRPSGWLHEAYALRRSPDGGLALAEKSLEDAYAHFPDEPTIPYNLACYACQRGQHDEGWEWLLIAAQKAPKESIQAMALADPDLEPLWGQIRKL